jgi:hypothetical protein
MDRFNYINFLREMLLHAENFRVQMTLVRALQQKLSEAQIREVRRVMSVWMQALGTESTLRSQSFVQLMIDTLRIVPSIGPTDLAIINAIFGNPTISLNFNRVDVELRDTFQEVLKRTLVIYCDSLSLSELYDVYRELLAITSDESNIHNARTALSRSLIERIAGGQRIPANFPLLHFLDCLSNEITPEVLDEASKWTFRKVKYAQTDSLREASQEELKRTALHIQSLYEKLHSKPSLEFIETVKILIAS